MGRLGLWITVAAAALSTAACGFEPMYGRDRGTNPMTAPVAAELSAIRVYAVELPQSTPQRETPARLGQDLRNRLVYSLSPYGEPARPRYGLTIKMQPGIGYLAPNKDGYTTVTQSNISVAYTLTNMINGQVLKTGNVQVSNSSRNLGPRYASIAAERSLEDGNIVELAQGIAAQLSGWFASPANRVGQPISQEQQPAAANGLIPSTAAPTP